MKEIACKFINHRYADIFISLGVIVFLLFIGMGLMVGWVTSFWMVGIACLGTALIVALLHFSAVGVEILRAKCGDVVPTDSTPEK
jgi:hypothetical protein